MDSKSVIVLLRIATSVLWFVVWNVGDGSCFSETSFLLVYHPRLMWFFYFVTWGFLLCVVFKPGILEITAASLIIYPVLKSWHCVPCSVDLAKLNEPNSLSVFCMNVFKLAFLDSWLCYSSVMIYLGCVFVCWYLGKVTEASPKSMYILLIASLFVQ